MTGKPRKPGAGHDAAMAAAVRAQHKLDRRAAAYHEALHERDRAFALVLSKGGTLRAIGERVGLSAAAVHKALDRNRKDDSR